MITSPDINKEVNKTDKMLRDKDITDSQLLYLIAKGVNILVKLARDIRSNQVTMMKAQDIKLRPPVNKDKYEEEK